jgi:hypothetical protein
MSFSRSIFAFLLQDNFSMITLLQIFEVMMMIVFLKSTVLHFESVSLQSSKSWSNVLNTSGCAFSTSSKRITEYGFLLTASVSSHHSSYQTYHGAAQINLETVNFS